MLASRATDVAAAASAAKITRGHSCILCYQRKVKCDGQRPCSTCRKSQVECISKVPTAPRRKAKSLATRDEQLLERLQRCEALLRLHGLNLEDNEDRTGTLKADAVNVRDVPEESKSPESGSGTDNDNGKLIVEDGHSRYIENDLWTYLSDELENSKDVVQGSDDDESDPLLASYTISSNAGSLLFGRPMLKSLVPSHPTPVQIFLLWQTYLDNVNPLLKLFHAPTVQQSILDAAGNLENIPKSTEALMFAIYFLSITSLRNNDCERIMGESRPALLARFSNATQQALINAELFKSSNMVVLQAFTLFLLAMRPHYDPHTLWLLSGLAVRMGQKLGLHRESASRNLSVFEAETRRRLWWQVSILDFRSAQLSGMRMEGDQNYWDTARPLNINDTDLSPAMKEQPKEHDGCTDMLFCSIRYEIGDFMRESGLFSTKRSCETTMAAKDKAVNDLEERLQRKYIRYCDQSIPLHLLSAALASSAIYQMRLLMHHPRQYPDKGASMPQEGKDMLFSTSLRMIEFDNLGQTTDCIRGFLWHMNNYIQLDALIYVVGELRNRFQGEEVDSAWQQVEQTFGNHPELLLAPKNTLNFALGNLAVKAWDKRVAAMHNLAFYQLPTPRFISVLRSQRNIPDIKLDDFIEQGTLANHGQQGQMGDIASNWDMNLIPNDMAMDASPMDWEYWQTLIDGSEFPMVDVNGQQIFTPDLTLGSN